MTQDQLLALPLPTPEDQKKGLGIQTFNDPDAALVSLFNGVDEAGKLVWSGPPLAYYREMVVKALHVPGSIESFLVRGYDWRVVVWGVMGGHFSLDVSQWYSLPPAASKVKPFEEILAYQKVLNDFAGGAHTAGG